VQQLRGGGAGQEQSAPVQAGDREQRQLQLGDDAEAARAGTAQRQNSSGARSASISWSPVRGDQPQPVHVVRGEAVAAAERAHRPPRV
jgi:hypothetical protein